MDKDTATPVPRDPNDTSTFDIFDRLLEVKPCVLPEPYFNRGCKRYAKKHKISLEEAFNRLCKNKK